MSNFENIFLIASLTAVIITLLSSTVFFIVNRRKNIQANDMSIAQTRQSEIGKGNRFIWVLTILTLLFITMVIVFRVIQTGHGPFSNMYEFAISFAWGIIVMGIVFQWRYKSSAVKNIGLIVVLLLLIFAIIQHAKPQPLIPALQQSLLLSVHVASAVVAYGTLTIGFAAALLYIYQNSKNSSWLPDKDILDAMSYQSVIIGFPFLTLTIILGALWANVAWGRYWGWDPKETASFVTWLFYVAYIHARVIRRWKGLRVAILLIIGFGAILLTFFGNYIFSGLHAY